MTMNVHQINISAGVYHNPTVVSVLIQHLVVGCTDNYNEKCHIGITYYAVPLLLIENYYKLLNRTRESSGIEKFVNKFISEKKTDLLVKLNEEARKYQSLTSQSIFLGLKCNLFGLDESRSFLYCRPEDFKPRLNSSLSLSGKTRNAKKLGTWLRGVTPTEAIALLNLGVA